MREFTIAPETEGKGRSFQGFLAASIEASAFWTGGQADTDNVRPVWAVVLASEAESRPLIANLRMGKKGVFGTGDRYSYRRKTDKVEFLKSARYAALTQRMPAGVATTLYLHDLFTLDPGMVDPMGISFILTLPAVDVAAQKWDREAAHQHLQAMMHTTADPDQPVPSLMRKLLDLAPYFAAYVDRRTRCPMPADPRFYAQLLMECLNAKLAYVTPQEKRGYWEKVWGEHDSVDAVGVEALGFTTPVFFKASHEDFQTLLADAAARYFRLIGFESGKAQG